MKAFWGLSYKKHPELWSKIFTVQSSDKSYEEEVENTGFGLMPVKPEGDAIRYDSATQGATKRYTAVTYGSGFILTREAIDDGQYESKAKMFAESLAHSAQTTKETVHANVFNRAFNSSYVGGDGKEWMATDHPTVNGTQSNELATAADLSEASVEDLCIMIMNATDSRGNRIGLTPKQLIVPNALIFDARRIIESELQAGTANNDKNVVGGMFKGGLVNWSFLSDTDAFFVTTDAPNGLKHYKRWEGKFTQDNDFDSENAKAKFVERYSCGVTDFRCGFGTPGS